MTTRTTSRHAVHRPILTEQEKEFAEEALKDGEAEKREDAATEDC